MLTSEIKEGSIVIVRRRSGDTVEVTVENYVTEGKNGTDVIDYTHMGQSYWAYVTQITEVVRA